MVRLVGDIPMLSNSTYSNTTGCGLCVRQGNIFCRSYESRELVCCGKGDWGCIQDAQSKAFMCATSDPANSTSNYYYDHDTMLWFDWCGQRHPSPEGNGCGCGIPAPLYSAYCRLSGNLSDTMQQDLLLNRNQIGYGGNCIYSIETGCGYPMVTVTGSDIDVIYAYNKTYWTLNRTGEAVGLKPDSGWDFIEKVEAG